MAPMRPYWMSFAALFVFVTSTARGSVVILSRPVGQDQPHTSKTKPPLNEMHVGYSVAVSPLPTPAANGMTKYQEVVYYTRVVAVHNKTTSITLLSTPTAIRTYTAEHGASSRIASDGADPPITFNVPNPKGLVIPNALFKPAFIENCTMNVEKNEGVCVMVMIFNETIPGIRTDAYNTTLTQSGPLQAYATATATATVAAGSPVISQPGIGTLGGGLLLCFIISISAGLFL